MRAVIAVRVSPRPAENVRYSPEIQEQQCREWCEANGHTVVDVVRDILISGGSRSRFTSILAAIDEHSPELFVVADLSRWTRDTPTRYYAMRAILEDAGIRLVSVAEGFVGSDMPFSDTITTAIVEANYQQRVIANAKTSVGVRKAWAAGKRWSTCFGWTFADGVWTQDVPRIEALYRDWIDGVPAREMALKHGVHVAAIRNHIRAVRQRDIIPDLWQQAQMVGRPRALRQDAKWGAVYRGLLVCPFCGWTMRQTSNDWGVYRCPRYYEPSHEWLSLSARKWVTPVVRGVVAGVKMPATAYQGGSTDHHDAEGTHITLRREMDRLSEAWAKGRLTDERYEKAVTDYERRLAEPVRPEPQVAVVRTMEKLLPYLDCDSSRWHPHTCDRCPRDRRVGDEVNKVLRSLIEHIVVRADRTVDVKVWDEYVSWK